MLKTLTEYSEKARNIINNNPECQKMMDELQKVAIEKNLSPEQWKAVKQSVFENALIYCLMHDKETLDKVGTALYHELRNENN